MSRLMMILISVCRFSASLGELCNAAELWPLENLKTPPAMKWLDDSSPIRSLTYENEKFEGHTTDVFAFYATPGTISGDTSKDKDLPAVVLIHGGGGTAFAQWAMLWAKRGYAAIAMDLGGQRPPAPKFDQTTGDLVTEKILDELGAAGVDRFVVFNSTRIIGRRQIMRQVDHKPRITTRRPLCDALCV